MSFADNASSFAATIVRLARGVYPKVTRDQRPGTMQMLELYDFEGCPYCRKAREVLSELDLDYRAHPVAHGSSRRGELKALGGRVQVPYLIDPNTNVRLYESDDIIAYLNQAYGNGKRAGWSLPLPRLLDDANSMLVSGVRLGRGARCRVPNARPGLEPITLYNMEGSPFCRKVREVLSELDLEHIVRNVPKGSPQRAALLERGGKVQVPYLIDPNTGTEMYESAAIVAYLESTYAAAAEPAAGRATKTAAKAAR